MKKRIVAIFIFTIMALAVFAEGFSETISGTISQIIPADDLLVVVRLPVYDDNDSSDSVFGKYLKAVLENDLTNMGKSLFDLEANERSEEFLALLSDRGYDVDLSAFNVRKAPNGEISSVYVVRNNMVQISFVYKQYKGDSKRTSLEFSTKGLPGLTYVSEDANLLKKRLQESVSGNSPEDARSLCLMINSLEDKKNNTIKEYNESIVVKQNALESWYWTEYNRRIVGAKKQPWETDEDFKKAVHEERVALNLELEKKESELLREAALGVVNYSTIDIQQEIDVYNSILAEKQFVVQTNNCLVMEFDAVSQCFPVQISVNYPSSNPQITYTKEIKCFLSKSDEVLSRSERGKRYNEFLSGTPSAEITYHVIPSGANDGIFVNNIQSIRLLNVVNNTVIYEESLSERANAFLPSAVNSSVPARVAIVSYPSGASIKIDYVQKGKTPLVISDMERGEHVIEAVWEDGATSQKIIKVIPGSVETVELEKRR